MRFTAEELEELDDLATAREAVEEELALALWQGAAEPGPVERELVQADLLECTTRWMMAEETGEQPRAETDFQRLLKRHYELGRAILRIEGQAARRRLP